MDESTILFKAGKDIEAANLIDAFCKNVKQIDKKDAHLSRILSKQKQLIPQHLKN
jgi:hypothetical protein